jgi:hypothetical protein
MLAIGLGASLVVAACARRAPVLVTQDLLPAQRALEQFARALGAWDTDAIARRMVGGEAHPVWRVQRAALEGRGVRFANVSAGAVRRLTRRIAVAAIRFRLTGAGVVSDDRLKVSRVLLIELPDGWRVSYFGTRVAVTRQLAWIAGGGEPLEDPFFKKLVERYEAKKNDAAPR